MDQMEMPPLRLGCSFGTSAARFRGELRASFGKRAYQDMRILTPSRCSQRFSSLTR